MARILWTALALADLQAISYYIEADRGIETANRVCRIIYDAIQLLRRFPELGKQGIEEGTREWIVPSLPSYVVAYNLVPGTINILRIWHAAQKRN